MVFGLTLGPGSVGAETDCVEAVVGTSGETPTAKRQRRLTLTAMTGLICQLSEECPKHEPGASPKTSHEAASPDPAPAADQSVISKAVSEEATPQDTERESSPIKRLKRARASISVTATAEVMAAQAAKTLAKSPGGKQDAGAQALRGERSSDSSDSTEEEDDCLALRVRRAQAFECGALAVTDIAQSSPVHQQGDLSPCSKLAFDRGVRAAEVAAKAAAAMMLGDGRKNDATPSSVGAQRGANRAPFGQRPRGGA